MIRGKVCPPGFDAFRRTTVALGLSMTNPNADTIYGVANLLHDNPARLTKASGVSTAITIPLPADVTLVGVTLHNTNATTASITSGAGLNQVITVPAVDLDGQRLGARYLFTGIEVGLTDDGFVVNLSRAAGVVHIGRIALWLVATDVNWEPGRDYGVVRPGDVRHTTRLGTVVHDSQGLRQRWWEMTFTLAEDATVYRGLEASSQGAVLPFPLIPDELVNDAAWVYTPDAYKEKLTVPGRASIGRRFLELCNGPING